MKMLLKKMNFSFVADKIIDGLFIFIGVYVAFYFNQNQQSVANRKELDFNIEQIMRDLPSEKPPEKVPGFKIIEIKNKSGSCQYKIDDFTQDSKFGENYLHLVRNRGLTQLLPSQDVIGLLTTYYENYFKSYTETFNLLKKSLDERKLSISDGTCISSEKIKSHEEGLSFLWAKLKVAEASKELIGFEIFKKLRAMGYKKPEVKNLFNYNFNLQIGDKDDSDKQKK